MHFIFILYYSLVSGLFQPKETVDLQIVVSNINNIKGNIELGIFDDASSFLKPGKEYKSYTKKVTKDSVVFTFTDIAKGNYAITVYHDVNSDKKCNLNFFGIPVEPYGFSQNFRPKIRKPKFDDCKINMNKNTSVLIKLID